MVSFFEGIFEIEFVDGDVICSDFQSDYWIFTTLIAHSTLGNGWHPVSGNRQFGYTYENNIFTLYTRGADRATTWYHAINNSNEAFKRSDEFWHQMQANFAAFIHDKQGSTVQGGALQERILRPNWEEVKNLLKSTSTITSSGIPCH
jgi:hypothetical protein